MANSSILYALNFSAEEQAQHIASISQKYGSQLDETLTAHLRSTLEVTPPFKGLAEKFGLATDLKGILDNKLAALRGGRKFQTNFLRS